MKLKQWLYGAAALTMMAACSDKDIAPDLGGNDDSKGSGYVSIAIGMPTSVGTRANDNFGDGDKSEYQVNNAAIVFFSGREESATFLKAYNVTNEFQFVKPDDDQITSSHLVTFPVEVTENTESLWAVALINFNNLFSVDKDNNLNLVGGGTFTGSIKEFMALTTTKDLAFANGSNFFMTNAPYTTEPGSGVASAPTGLIHFLAPVDKEKIAETKDKAKEDPAAEIFVERAVAKVTLERDLLRKPIGTIKSIAWVIDNTEPSSYVARNLVYGSYNGSEAPAWMAYTQDANFLAGLTIKPSQNYRFVGNSPFDATNLFYRLYFGYDPNGNGIDDGNLVVLKDADIDKNTFKPETSSQYCYENTFDVKHQDYLNTTRVILKVTFEDGIFFTRGIDRVTKYTSTDAQMSLAHFVVENADVVKTWTDYFDTPTTITIDGLDCIFDEKTNKGTGANKWINLGYEVKDGKLLISSIQLLNGEDNPSVVEFPENIDVNNIIADINSQVTFNAYVDGVSYYAVRIKHFGDDLTPWKEPNGETTTTAQSYPDYNANNYLGRYGVLRNNWYHLSISAIDKYGEPLVGNLVLDKTPDDKVDPEKAIACKINILSWAKRTQSEEL